MEKESDLDVYKANDYFPHGLTPPMVVEMALFFIMYRTRMKR